MNEIILVESQTSSEPIQYIKITRLSELTDIKSPKCINFFPEVRSPFLSSSALYFEPKMIISKYTESFFTKIRYLTKYTYL